MRRLSRIDATLDQWHVRGGEDLAGFMERSIRETDRVLVICTEAYVERAIGRQGGVGYEHTMVTGELMINVGTSKFIPVVRQTSRPATLPTELNTRLYFDLGPGAEYPTQLQALIKDLHNVQTPIPPLGPNPFQ